MRVGGRMLMNPWRIVLHGCQRIENRRQFLVLNVNQGEGFFGDIGRLSRHGNDLFPDETDAVTGQHWNVEQEPADAHLRQVGAGQYSVNPWQLSSLRNIDGKDARVREGAAQTLAPQHSWQCNICGIQRTTSDFSRPFNVTCRLADAD